jgi:predicted permease
MQDRISSLPGVVSVSGAYGTPFSSAWSIGRAGPEGALQDESLNQQSRYSYILPGYFETMGASLVEGRTFTPGEHADSVPVVMVDALLAQALWPTESAVGKILVTRPGGGDPTPHQVVGVVEHQKMETLAADGEDILYYPFRYYGARLGLTWTVRTAVPPESLVPLIRQQVAALNPDTPLTLVRTMESYLDQARAPTRFALALIGFFAGTALILAVIGLYGVLASGVQQRTSEIGVRVAFGAEPREIISLILGKGIRLLALGILAGLVGAIGITRFMTSLLVGVEPVDFPTFAWIGVLFTGVGVLACFLPARRATKVDPVRAIQAE